MRARLLLSMVWALLGTTLYSQTTGLWDQWGLAAGCHVNAQGSGFSYDWRKEIASTVKINLMGKDGERIGNCSATLVNQATPENELRQILILARHCITGGMGLDNDIDVDFTSDQHGVIFS